MRIVQEERDGASDSCAGTKSIEFRVEQRRARFKRGPESFFFARYNGTNKILLLHEIGIGLAHNFNSGVDERRRNEIGNIEQVRLAHRSTNDPTQHIAAAFIGWEDAVAHEETHGAGVLSENSKRNIGTLPRTKARIGNSLCSFYERSENISFKNRIDALEHTEDSFQTSASIDVLLWQLGVVTIGIASELHKHEIPDFKEPFVAPRCGPTLGAVCRTLVDVDL